MFLLLSVWSLWLSVWSLWLSGWFLSLQVCSRRRSRSVSKSIRLKPLTIGPITCKYFTLVMTYIVYELIYCRGFGPKCRVVGKWTKMNGRYSGQKHSAVVLVCFLSNSQILFDPQGPRVWSEPWEPPACHMKDGVPPELIPWSPSQPTAQCNFQGHRNTCFDSSNEFMHYSVISLYCVCCIHTDLHCFRTDHFLKSLCKFHPNLSCCVCLLWFDDVNK